MTVSHGPGDRAVLHSVLGEERAAAWPVTRDGAAPHCHGGMRAPRLLHPSLLRSGCCPGEGPRCRHPSETLLSPPTVSPLADQIGAAASPSEETPVLPASRPQAAPPVPLLRVLGPGLDRVFPGTQEDPRPDSHTEMSFTPSTGTSFR